MRIKPRSLFGEQLHVACSYLIHLTQSPMALPEFQVFQDRAGEFRWNLVSRNGETVCVSEGYTTRYGAWQSAKRIREIASAAYIRDIDV